MPTFYPAPTNPEGFRGCATPELRWQSTAGFHFADNFRAVKRESLSRWQRAYYDTGAISSPSPRFGGERELLRFGASVKMRPLAVFISLPLPPLRLA